TMNSVRCMIAVAALAFTMPAQAAVGDPEVLIYRVAGAVDDGGGGGLATSFFCTNFSGVAETLQILLRDPDGTPIGTNQAFSINHLQTVILSTHDATTYTDTNLATGAFQGTAAIAATSPNVTCTAMQVQTNITIPTGIALHMTRFSPAPGTQ